MKNLKKYWYIESVLAAYLVVKLISHLNLSDYYIFFVLSFFLLTGVSVLTGRLKYKYLMLFAVCLLSAYSLFTIDGAARTYYLTHGQFNGVISKLKVTGPCVESLNKVKTKSGTMGKIQYKEYGPLIVFDYPGLG